ncbi:MAG: GNAT family N-acetyltransferase, partial [Desulfovibrio sp.]|nr:GNAT family N-acetyltransferase [Desulfovibrio sp.]
MSIDLNFLAREAKVPEHSPWLMSSLSGGEPLVIGPWLFYAGSDWLMGIGYPLYKSETTFSRAFDEAAERTGAVNLFAIAPGFPHKRASRVSEEDRYWALSATVNIPNRLLNICESAARRLTVSLSDEFTAGHRRLWSEFLSRNSGRMNDRVRELYSRAPGAMRDGVLRSLDARDADGAIVASLLIDTRPANFVSYILGARTVETEVSHAAALHFSRLNELAITENKKFI